MSRQKPYILLIDDDEEDLEMLSTALSFLSTVKKIRNPRDAITFLSNSDSGLPKLIILDYNMPYMNGHQMLSLLKSQERLKNIPVVMHSTSIPDEYKKKLLDSGALACLIKPYTQVQFYENIKTLKGFLNIVTSSPNAEA